MTAAEKLAGKAQGPIGALGGGRGTPRKKILIVNCYFPDERQPVKRSHQVPNAVAPVLPGFESEEAFTF